jgi:hypothetical protein
VCAGLSLTGNVNGLKFEVVVAIAPLRCTIPLLSLATAAALVAKGALVQPPRRDLRGWAV